MNPYVGTSGYSYKEWKGTFYPRKLPATQMLPFYSAHFRTVEINYTFKRLPTALILEKWADAVPAADPKPTRRRCCSARHRAS